MLILNRHPDFNKGVNKVLKMVSMVPGPVDQISQFLLERFSVGTLTASNLTSFVRFLAKVTDSDTPLQHTAETMFRTLSDSGFFKSHLDSFTRAQVEAFNRQIAEIKSRSAVFNFLQLEVLPAETKSDAAIFLIQQIHNYENVYSSDVFLK